MFLCSGPSERRSDIYVVYKVTGILVIFSLSDSEESLSGEERRIRLLEWYVGPKLRLVMSNVNMLYYT